MVTVGTFFINIALATSLSYLWGLINAIQIISYLPEFNTMVPANVVSFYSFLNNIQNYNFLPFSVNTVLNKIGVTAGEFDD